MKSDIVKIIRRNESLEASIDELDVKIGLLVQNRICLQVIFFNYFWLMKTKNTRLF